MAAPCEFLYAYPPIPITEAMEITNNAPPSSTVPLYNISHCPYGYGQQVQVGKRIYTSTKNNNCTELIPAAGFTKLPTLEVDSVHKNYIVPNQYQKDRFGVPVYSRVPPSGVQSSGLISLDFFAMLDPNNNSTYSFPDYNMTAIDTLTGIIAPNSPAPNMNVRLHINYGGFTTIHGNRGIQQGNAGAALSLTITLLPLEVLLMIPYDTGTEKKVWYFVTRLPNDLNTLSVDDPITAIFEKIRYRYKNKPGQPTNAPLPTPSWRSFSSPENNSWTYLGWDMTTTSLLPTVTSVPISPTVPYLSQQIGGWGSDNLYRANTNLLAAGNRFFDPVTINYEGLKHPKLVDWEWTGVINPVAIYQPSPRLQTIANGILLFEWNIAVSYEQVAIYNITGDNLELKVTDNSGTEVYNETVDLNSVEADFFSNQKCVYIFKNIPATEPSVLYVRVTANDNTSQVGIGAVYPSTRVTLGGLAFAPSITGITTTREEDSGVLQDPTIIQLGRTVDKITFRTQSKADFLDYYTLQLRNIARLAKEHGYPTLFQADYQQKVFTALGYMPTFEETLKNHKIVTGTVTVTLASRCHPAVIYTGGDGSGTGAGGSGGSGSGSGGGTGGGSGNGNSNCVAVEWTYDATEYGTFDYPATEYNQCP